MLSQKNNSKRVLVDIRIIPIEPFNATADNPRAVFNLKILSMKSFAAARMSSVIFDPIVWNGQTRSSAVKA